MEPFGPEPKSPSAVVWGGCCLVKVCVLFIYLFIFFYFIFLFVCLCGDVERRRSGVVVEFCLTHEIE
jgi:hypothetical protein